MLERTDVITNEVLEPITFVLAQPTVCLLDLSTEQYVRCIHCGRKLRDIASVYRSHKCFVGFSYTATTALAHAIVTAIDSHSYSTIRDIQNTVLFVVSPRTAALLHRKLESTGTSRDNCRA